jgi:hypothetical protein
MIGLWAQAGVLFVEADPGFTFSGGPIYNRIRSHSAIGGRPSFLSAAVQRAVLTVNDATHNRYLLARAVSSHNS